MVAIPAYVDILAVAQRYSDVSSKQTATTHGGEHWGSCPLCGTGDNRFHVWPNRPRENGPTWWCRVCKDSGDIIDLVRKCEDVEFFEALELLEIDLDDLGDDWHDYRPRDHFVVAPPSKAWQERAFEKVKIWKQRLHESPGILDYLHNRGLKDEAIDRFNLGYNEQDWYDLRVNWGLPVDEKEKLFLPRGIVIPYVCNGAMWKVNIRKAVTEGGKYHAIAGSEETLFNGHSILDGKPVVLVEGEIDAVSGWQEAGDLATFVATSGAKKQLTHCIPVLERASTILVAFDMDANGSGDNGADYWRSSLASAMRWDPDGHDINNMLIAAKDIRGWVELGLELAQCSIEASISPINRVNVPLPLVEPSPAFISAQDEPARPVIDVAALRTEIGQLARAEDARWEYSNELDPRWPLSAKVYKRLRLKEGQVQS